MSIFDRLDPELSYLLREPLFEDLRDIARARQHGADSVQQRGADAHLDARRGDRRGRTERLSQEDLWVGGVAGSPDVHLRVYRSATVAEELPCLYWVHGGGYVMGTVDQDDDLAHSLVRKHGCAVVSVDWRHAPEDPFPAAADDCYAGLSWVFGDGHRYGIDTRRVVIGGSSSGAGCVAGLALQVRERADFKVQLQLLIAPMLDDRCATPSSRRVTDPRVWNREHNEIAWGMYLGDAYGTDAVSPIAAPARITTLEGLPPAFMAVGELDLFLDEDVTYALGLIAADVPTELHVYTGAHHGFASQAPSSAVARRLVRDIDDALQRAWLTKALA